VNILLSWVAKNNDPFSISGGKRIDGPTLQLLADPLYAGKFDKVFLFYTPDAKNKLNELRAEMSARGLTPALTGVEVALSNPTDYAEIYQEIGSHVDDLMKRFPETKHAYFVHVSPGTPQMQTIWFILVKSGRLPATMLQTVRPEDRGSRQSEGVVTVGLDIDRFPRIVRLEEQVQELQEQLGIAETFGEMFGRSQKAQQLFKRLRRAAEDGRCTVLLLGESGTGKELAARGIHRLGPRKDAPLLVFDCASVPATMIESELFGHAKGAFTGAVKDRKGLVEEAHKGTLFLDEIGDMPLELQTRLLRVIDAGEFRRVGENKTRKVDVRIVAATARDLTGMVREGKFRKDLFHRLNVFPIELPPLRERREDIPVLFDRFLEQFSRDRALEKPKIGKNVMELIVQHDWPGNVRELQNLAERVVVEAPEHISADWMAEQLELPNAVSPPTFDAGTTTLDEIERTVIDKRLKRFGGNKTRAARSLGIDRHTLARKIDRHKLTGP